VARVSAEQEVARLRFLEGMGLARRLGEASWELTLTSDRYRAHGDYGRTDHWIDRFACTQFLRFSGVGAEQSGVCLLVRSLEDLRYWRSAPSRGDRMNSETNHFLFSLFVVASFCRHLSNPKATLVP
jgi:hypothetical protein